MKNYLIKKYFRLYSNHFINEKFRLFDLFCNVFHIIFEKIEFHILFENE